MNDTTFGSNGGVYTVCGLQAAVPQALISKAECGVI